MPRHKLTPKIEQQIKDFEKKIGESIYTSAGWSTISGAELLKTPRGNELIDGQPIDQEKNYRIQVPVQRNINHGRRMRRAFLSGGEEALLNYLKPYLAGYTEEPKK